MVGLPLFSVPASQTFQGTQGLRDSELGLFWGKTLSPGKRGSKLLHSPVPTSRCPTPSQFKKYFLSTYYVLGGFSSSTVSIPQALVSIPSPPTVDHPHSLKIGTAVAFIKCLVHGTWLSFVYTLSPLFHHKILFYIVPLNLSTL